MAPTFPTFSCFFFFFFFCLFFSFLKMPYFLVQNPKCSKWPKLFFFFFLARYARLVFTNQINLICASVKVYKIVLLQLKLLFWNIYFGISFPWYRSIMFREKFVCLYLFRSLKTVRTSLLFMFEIPTFVHLFQNFEPCFISSFSMVGTWKPDMYKFV